MERENNAESMRNWSEKKKEKEKASKKKHYEKNKVEIFQQYVEKKSKMAEEKRTCAPLTVQPKNNACARTSFCVRKKKFFLRLLAGRLSLSRANRKNFFAVTW